MATKSILVLHGPNLNLLGEREPQHYDKQTLEDIDQALKTIASAKSIKLETMQSNSAVSYTHLTLPTNREV